MTKRHHPIRIIFKLYHAIRNLIIPIAIFIFNEIKGDTGSQPYWVYVITAFITILICVWSVLSWFNDIYWTDEGSLHIKYGIFSKTERVIPLSKIRSMNTEQNWMYRLIGVVTMELQTADSNEQADARIILSLKSLNQFANLIENTDRERELSLSSKKIVTKKEIFMLSISSKSFWVGIPIILTIWQFISGWIFKEDSIEDTSIGSLAKSDVWQQINFSEFFYMFLVVIITVSVLSWLVSLVVLQVKYRGWTVQRKDNMLTIEYGFFEKKVIKVRSDKIQSIRIKEKMLSRFFGYSSLYMDCIGYAGEHGSKLILPAIRNTEIQQALHLLLPEFELTNDLLGLNKGAKYYPSIFPSVILLVGSVAGYFFEKWLLAILILIPIWHLINAYQYKHSYWGIYRNQLVIVKGKFTKTSVYVLRRAVESITFEANRLQSTLQIGCLDVDIDSPSKPREYSLLGINRQQFVDIQSWYKNNQS